MSNLSDITDSLYSSLLKIAHLLFLLLPPLSLLPPPSSFWQPLFVPPPSILLPPLLVSPPSLLPPSSTLLQPKRGVLCHKGYSFLMELETKEVLY